MHVLSREPRDVELFSGRLDAGKLSALLDTIVPTSDVDHWWLCGPFGMLTDADAVLAGHGVPRTRVHRELFYVDEPPPPLDRADESAVDGPAASVTVVLDGRETTLTLPADTPILDAAQRVRADLPFACKGGVCGTCRAKVTAGKVEMRRNYALEQHELDEGFVLTCQALPRRGARDRRLRRLRPADPGGQASPTVRPGVMSAFSPGQRGMRPCGRASRHRHRELPATGQRRDELGPPRRRAPARARARRARRRARDQRAGPLPARGGRAGCGRSTCR